MARLKKTGIDITKNHVVGFYSPTTETTVVKINNQKFIVRENPNSRWQPDFAFHISSISDQIAAEIIEKTKIKIGGIVNRRYKLHEINFGNLLLRTVGVRDRIKLTTAVFFYNAKPIIDGAAFFADDENPIADNTAIFSDNDKTVVYNTVVFVFSDNVKITANIALFF